MRQALQRACFPISEIDKDFATFPRRQNDVLELRWRREIAGVGRNRMEDAPVVETQTQNARVRTIEQAQAHHALRHGRKWRDDAIHDDRVAEHAHHRRHRASIVGQGAIAAESAVLQHERKIVDAIVVRQAALAVPIVADEQQAGKAEIDLKCGRAMRMRVIPQRRRRLIELEIGTPHAAGLDRIMWSAIDGAGNDPTMPVDRGRFFQLVADRESGVVAAPQKQRRPQIRCRKAVRRHRRIRPESVLRSARDDLDRVILRTSIDETGDGQSDLEDRLRARDARASHAGPRQGRRAEKNRSACQHIPTCIQLRRREQLQAPVRRKTLDLPAPSNPMTS